MKIIGDKVIFESTGREIYANGGIIGLSPLQDVYAGGGEGFWIWYDEAAADDGYTERDYTKQEGIELANFMIARWQEFRARAEKQV